MFCIIKKKIFFLRIYKTNVISAEGYKNAKVHFLKITKTGERWISIKDVGDGVAVKTYLS